MGDAEAGRKAVSANASLAHMIVDAAGETIQRAARSVPNLFGSSASKAGRPKTNRYGDDLSAAGESRP